MSAVIKQPSIRQIILDDVRYGGVQAHLEPHEVPRWIEEAGDQDIAAELGDALSDLEDKPREKFNALLVTLCQQGERMSMQQGMDLLAGMRAALTDRCIRQAQKFVEDDLRIPGQCSKCGPSCTCHIAWNE